MTEKEEKKQPEPKKVEVETDKLSRVLELVENQADRIKVLEETVSRQRQLEAKKAIEREEHPEPLARLKLWEGVPIIKRETTKHEYRRNPLTNEAIDLSHKIKITLADGRIVDNIDFELLNTLHEEVTIRQKEAKRVGLEEVWVVEYVDPDMAMKYGDFEISITSSGAVNN